MKERLQSLFLNWSSNPNGSQANSFSSIFFILLMAINRADHFHLRNKNFSSLFVFRWVQGLLLRILGSYFCSSYCTGSFVGFGNSWIQFICSFIFLALFNLVCVICFNPELVSFLLPLNRPSSLGSWTWNTIDPIDEFIQYVGKKYFKHFLTKFLHSIDGRQWQLASAGWNVTRQ